MNELDRLIRQTSGYTSRVEIDAKPGMAMFIVDEAARVLGVRLDWLVRGEGPKRDPKRVTVERVDIDRVREIAKRLARSPEEADAVAESLAAYKGGMTDAEIAVRFKNPKARRRTRDTIVTNEEDIGGKPRLNARRPRRGG